MPIKKIYKTPAIVSQRPLIENVIANGFSDLLSIVMVAIILNAGQLSYYSTCFVLKERFAGFVMTIIKIAAIIIVAPR